MRPGFKSRRRRHMWVEFVVGSLPCSERFFSGYSGIPLSSKTNISNFQFDQKSGIRRTTLWMCYLQIVIYLFIINCHIPKDNKKYKLTHSPLSRLWPPIRIPLVTSSVLMVKDNFVRYCNFNYILFYLRCKNMASDWKSMDLKRSLWKTN